MVGEAAWSVSWRSLRIQFGLGGSFESAPGFPVFGKINRAVLSLKIFASCGHDGEFIILEAMKLVPGDPAMFMSW